VEDYLYYRPDGRANLEQVRNAINTLLVTPHADVTPANVVISLGLSEVFLPQAGVFQGGLGLRAIAMLAPLEDSRPTRPYYAFWGFSLDMKYLIFAALDTQLTFGTFAQASLNDFQPFFTILDRIVGLRINASPPPEASSANAAACPDAPEITLAIGDWARVSVDPPLPSRIRSSPGSGGEFIGEAQPGENLLILDGPQCANGYAWWKVRSLTGVEGWTAEGDTSAYWLAEPVSAWYSLPTPIPVGNTKTFDLREIRISPNIGLVSDIQDEYYPLATPLPTPENAQTPWPNDPRGSDYGTVGHSAHSTYELIGVGLARIAVFDIQDPVSRYYLNQLSYDGCTDKVKDILEKGLLAEEYLQTFCGINGGIPTHFKVAIKEIDFQGGKGLRFLLSSANYLTVNRLNYIFQGISDDGRYFIHLLYYDVYHPYIVDDQLWDTGIGPLLAWKDGQYEAAEKSYDIFNERMRALLEAGVVPLFPSLEVLDAMMASIEIK
jgi:hypothetical protein